MSTETKSRRSDPWVNPPSPGEKPEPGYEEHVRKSIEDGRAQIKAGKGIPAEKVWKELGIE